MAEKRKRRRLSSSSAQLVDSDSEPSPSVQLSDTESTAPSVLSMKSDVSKHPPLNFPLETTQSDTESTAPSVVSMKSDVSKHPPLNFPLEKTQSETESTAPSVVSMKSDVSKHPPLNFQSGPSAAPSVISLKSNVSMHPPLNFPLHQTQSELTEGKKGKKFKRDPEHQRHTEEDTVYSQLLEAKKNLKKALQKKFSKISEGNGDQERFLNRIYTELMITAGESEGPHEEHSFRQIKQILERRPSTQFATLADIFKPLPGQEKPHRVVLTKGVAGIGKSFSVQKFILDWAEGRENQDTDFVVCLTFRELNLRRKNKSLYQLLTEFHPSLNDFDHYPKTRVIVILDGLDESRFQMDFKNNSVVTSVREVTSVGNLLANLIQGNLLPDANLWITSRPAAASQIPAQFVDMVTEISGFNDSQKEEYFRRRFSDNLSLANRIMSHIRSSQSLDIMCQIPIFCWISAILFQEVFGGDEKAETAEIPQTLTEMMARFLFVQTKRRNRKYEKTGTDRERLLRRHREFLLKLGKLAFVHLQTNNLIFYDEDLEKCGIDLTEATVYSGFCTAVLREEDLISQKKVFSFVHLTIQEFFAALFVYDCFTNKKTEELGDFLDLKDEEHTLLDLLKMTVEKVLEKKNGHLDFFLRFLLGLMVETNRRVLQGLLMTPDLSQDADKKILTHLKAIRRKTLSPDSSVNLFQTMVEMRDHKVKDEIQEYLQSPGCSKAELTPLHCSALAYMLQVSKNDLDVLDLKSYNTSEEGRRRLIPAVRSSKKAILADCKVTEEWATHLALGLRFPHSPLTDLDLSNNDLKDSGVKLLCEGLSSQNCRLKILRLSGCQVTKEGCVALASALKSNPSHLMELDLSYNHPGDEGVKVLSDLSNDSQYKLNVQHCGIDRLKPGFKKYACELTLDANTAHKNLRLSEANRKVTWEKDEQPYPDHLERFDLCQQVLCEQGLDGRCYFEVEAFEPFAVGLTYKTIGRKGDVNDCKLGRNNKSWSLTCSTDGCFVWHNDQRVNVSSLCSRASRLGVYLDWPAGTLSFYRVTSDSQMHLHTFRATFSRPLFPAVELHSLSSALFCDIT